MKNKDIVKNVSLAELFHLKKKANPGFLYMVIDTSERDEIVAQKYWDEDYYLQPIPLAEGKTESDRLFQLWEKIEWEINSKSKIQEREIELARKRKSEMENKSRHDEFMARKDIAIKFFMDKFGKSRMEATKIVENACNPRKTKVKDFNPDTLEEVTTESVNELDLKIQKKFNLVY